MIMESLPFHQRYLHDHERRGWGGGFGFVLPCPIAGTSMIIAGCPGSARGRFHDPEGFSPARRGRKSFRIMKWEVVALSELASHPTAGTAMILKLCPALCSTGHQDHGNESGFGPACSGQGRTCGAIRRAPWATPVRRAADSG
jgi:hypothetical protein